MTLRPAIALSGIIAPLENVAISNSLNEPALAVDVNSGDSVRAGAVLAQLDTSDLQANLVAAQRTVAQDQARAVQTRFQGQMSVGQGGDQLRSAGAAVDQARQKFALDQLNLTRDRRLVAQGYIAQQTVDQQATTVAGDQAAVQSALAALQTAQTTVNLNGNASVSSGLQGANYAAALAAVASARAQAAQIAVQIAKGTIVAPLSGVVVNRNINPGEYPGTRTIFTLQQIDNVYANFSAGSAQVFNIREGSTVQLRGTEIGANTYPGRVTAVLNQVNPGSTNFTVQVRVPNPAHRLHPGMVVSGTVRLPSARGVAIPVTAFLDDTHSSVMTVENGVAKTAHVKEKVSDNTHSIVIGLQPGETLIANGQVGIMDGQRVAVR